MPDKDNRKSNEYSSFKKRMKKFLSNLLIYFLIIIMLAIVVIILSFFSAVLVIYARSSGNPNESFTSLFQKDFWDTFIILLKINGVTDAIIFGIIPKDDLLDDS